MAMQTSRTPQIIILPPVWGSLETVDERMYQLPVPVCADNLFFSSQFGFHGGTLVDNQTGIYADQPTTQLMIALTGIEGVNYLTFMYDKVTIRRVNGFDWRLIEPPVIEAIKARFGWRDVIVTRDAS